MIWYILLVVLGGAGLCWLGWISVQSLRQAMLLGSLPPGILGVQDGQRVALHGKVKVYRPVKTSGIQSLWCRVTQSQADSAALSVVFRSRRRWRTVFDQAEMATFSLIEKDEEIPVEDLPTEVQGTQTVTESDSGDLLDQVFSRGTITKTEWLPMLEEATAVGRIERRGEGRVLVKDPDLGLLLSPHPASYAARIEYLKGGFGLAGVLAGLVVLFVLAGALNAKKTTRDLPPRSLGNGDTVYVATSSTLQGRTFLGVHYHAHRGCSLLEMELSVQREGKLYGPDATAEIETLIYSDGNVRGPDGKEVKLQRCNVCTTP
jgi:hypothetical protein